MSRIGKQPIEIPSGVEIKFEPLKVHTNVMVKGPLGTLSRPFSNDIALKHEGSTLTLKPTAESIFLNALWGTYASHLGNMVAGVTKGFSKKLQIEGIGYKADVVGTTLVLSLGFSHQVKMPIPATIKVTSEKGLLTITGPDKELVGQFAASVRALKVPEPYKGKGIRYDTEVVRRKQGKKSVA
ncbi:MAG: 50S ribosomal protein L6 [Patescibacteria group bacterium]